MHVTLGDHAVERRLDLEVLAEIFHRLRLGFGGLDRIVVRAHQRFSGLDRLLGDDAVVLRHDTGRSRRGLEAIVGALRSGEFGRGFGSLELHRLGFRFGLDDLRLHFRRFQNGEELPLLDCAPSIDINAFHKAGDLRVNGNSQVGLKLARELDLPLDSPGRDADHLDGRLRRNRYCRRRQQQRNWNCTGSI